MRGFRNFRGVVFILLILGGCRSEEEESGVERTRTVALAEEASDCASVPDGTNCGIGLVCQAGSCQSGCYIGGQVFADGALRPASAAPTMVGACPPVDSNCTRIKSSSYIVNGKTYPGCDYCMDPPCARLYCNAPLDTACTEIRQGTDADSCTQCPVCITTTCEQCIPSISTTAWSLRTEGADCGDGKMCGGGTCTRGCFIDGVVYADGVVNPQNTCQRCAISTSTTKWTTVGDGTSCDDENACTQGDICTAGVCHGDAYACTPNDCEASSICDGHGSCTVVKKPNGTACMDDGNVCTSDMCDGAGACIHTALDDIPCDDSNVLTKSDVCTNGICTGVPLCTGIVCTASDPCHDVGVCDSSTGICSNPIKINGTECDDGNACTKDDVCTSGTCNGTTYMCAPGDCEASSICDGHGGCTVVKKPNGAACMDDGNVCTSDTCDGTGVCGHTDLPDGTNCGSGQICQAGSCGAKCLIDGQLYGAGTIRPTNACEQCAPLLSTTAWSPRADGIACDDGSVCTQTDVCNAGVCVGSNPLSCAAPDACQEMPVCDAVMGCKYVPKSAGTICGVAPSCDASGKALPQAMCDGVNGACPAVTAVNCGLFACVDGACLVTCAGASDCVANANCNSGICKPKASQGSACATTAECATGMSCVDGFCCDTTCEGQCEACDVSGQEGTCSPVKGDPHNGRTACASDGSACGGTCDGSKTNGCVYPTSLCRDASCDATTDVATLEAACDGQGNCPAVQTISCAPFLCGTTICNGNCQEKDECASDSFCASGVCTEKLKQGSVCSNASQCASGFCVDGVCCTSACKGQCEACDVSGQEGTCSPVKGDPHNGRTACVGTGACQGVCDGMDTQVCSFPNATTTCAAGFCADGKETATSKCNGAGICEVGAETSCGAYACGADACKTNCASNADCVSGYGCIAGACVIIEGGDAGAGGNAGGSPLGGAGGSTIAGQGGSTTAGTGSNAAGQGGAGGSRHAGTGGSMGTGTAWGTGADMEGGACGCKIVRTEGDSRSLVGFIAAIAVARRRRRGT